MTKDSEKKPTKRSKAKFPALQKKFSPRMRKDFIETDYINGVYDCQGRQVIRSMNEEEKKWLNDFYEESIGASFRIDDEYSELRRQVNKLYKKSKKEELNEEEADLMMDLLIKMHEKSDGKLLYENPVDQWELTTENNARNRCRFNRLKSGGMLDELDYETYDTILDESSLEDDIMSNDLDPRLE